MASYDCPYCGNGTFVGATTRLRSSTVDVAGDVDEQVWANECVACGKWSAHVECEKTQRALDDPDDPNADIAREASTEISHGI